MSDNTEYISDKDKYLKHFKILSTCSYTQVSEMSTLLLRDLDNYSRGEVTIEQIAENIKPIAIDENDDTFPNREYILPFNYMRAKLIQIFKDEFGGI